MALPRVVPEGGLTIGDRHFSRGTVLSINPWVIHHSKECWGPDAREFNPDRWLGKNVYEQDKYYMPVSVFALCFMNGTPDSKETGLLTLYSI